MTGRKTILKLAFQLHRDRLRVPAGQPARAKNSRTRVCWSLFRARFGYRLLCPGFQPLSSLVGRRRTHFNQPFRLHSGLRSRWCEIWNRSFISLCTYPEQPAQKPPWRRLREPEPARAASSVVTPKRTRAVPNQQRSAPRLSQHRTPEYFFAGTPPADNSFASADVIQRRSAPLRRSELRRIDEPAASPQGYQQAFVPARAERRSGIDGQVSQVEDALQSVSVFRKRAYETLQQQQRAEDAALDALADLMQTVRRVPVLPQDLWSHAGILFCLRFLLFFPWV